MSSPLPTIDTTTVIIIRDAVGVMAAASIAFGAGMIYLPAGFIVGGVIVLVGVVLAARSVEPRGPQMSGHVQTCTAATQ